MNYLDNQTISAQFPIGLLRVISTRRCDRPDNNFAQTLFPIGLRRETQQRLDTTDISNTVPDVAFAKLSSDCRRKVFAPNQLGQRAGNRADRPSDTRSDVENLTVAKRTVHRQSCSMNHIVNRYEIATLTTIFVYDRRLALKQSAKENSQYSGVGVTERLARTIDIEQPQANRGDIVDLAEAQRQLFLIALGERIDVPRKQRGVLGSWYRLQHRAALWIDNVPPPALNIHRRTDGDTNQRAGIGVAINPFAIASHRREDDQLLQRLLA